MMEHALEQALDARERQAGFGRQVRHADIVGAVFANIGRQVGDLAIDGMQFVGQAEVLQQREARARQNAIQSRFESAVTRARARELMNGSRTEDAFSKFEILERRADFAEGRADALGMTGPKSLEEEIAELRAAESVDKELEAMKAAMKARGK